MAHEFALLQLLAQPLPKLVFLQFLGLFELLDWLGVISGLSTTGSNRIVFLLFPVTAIALQGEVLKLSQAHEAWEVK